VILIVPQRAKRQGEAQALVRRYFEERFRHGETIELYFNGLRCCYVRVTRVLPAMKEDGSPTSIYKEHRERYELIPGVGTEVGPGVPG
jgi:hypothetical protein